MINNRFSIYTSEEKSTLKLMEELAKQTNENSEKINNKTDLLGDHKGTWQGLNPHQTNEGLGGQVIKNTNDITSLNDNIADFKKVENAYKSVNKTILKMCTGQLTQIYCLGDSITTGCKSVVGNDGTQVVQYPYPQSLQIYLRRFYHSNINVYNSGFPGFRTDELLPKIDQIITQGADAVVLMMGTNDILQRKDLKQAILNIDSMIKKLTQNNIEVVLCNVPNITDKTYNNLVPLYNTMLQVLADTNDIPLIDVNGMLENIVNQTYISYKELQNDGVHLGDNYYIPIADILFCKVFYKDTIMCEDNLIFPVVNNSKVKTDCNSINTDVNALFKDNYTWRINGGVSTGTYMTFVMYNTKRNRKLYTMGTNTASGCNGVDISINDNNIYTIAYNSTSTKYNAKKIIGDLPLGIVTVQILKTGVPNGTTNFDSYFNAFGVVEIENRNAFEFPTLQNGFTNYGTGVEEVGYILNDGVLSLKGTIRPGTITTNTIMFTLLPKYRPSNTRFVNFMTELGICQGVISSDGTVSLYNATTGKVGQWVSFDGINIIL